MTRICICLLGVWLAAFIPLTVAFHHHPDAALEPGGLAVTGAPEYHAGADGSSGCDICARLIVPIDLDAPKTFEFLSEIRGISFIPNDYPPSSRLFSNLRDRSPPIPLPWS